MMYIPNETALTTSNSHQYRPVMTEVVLSWSVHHSLHMRFARVKSRCLLDEQRCVEKLLKRQSKFTHVRIHKEFDLFFMNPRNGQQAYKRETDALARWYRRHLLHGYHLYLPSSYRISHPITYANNRAAQEAVGGINFVERTTTGATWTSRNLVLNVYYRCTDESITNWWDGQRAKTKAEGQDESGDLCLALVISLN